jgi:hypothetical protein
MKQDIFVELIKNNTEAMNKVANAVEVLNDQNAMHYAKDDERDTTLREVVSANRVVITIFYLTVGALVILAGAERVFQFIKI